VRIQVKVRFTLKTNLKGGREENIRDSNENIISIPKVDKVDQKSEKESLTTGNFLKLKQELTDMLSFNLESNAKNIERSQNKAPDNFGSVNDLQILIDINSNFANRLESAFTINLLSKEKNENEVKYLFKICEYKSDINQFYVGIVKANGHSKNLIKRIESPFLEDILLVIKFEDIFTKKMTYSKIKNSEEFNWIKSELLRIKKCFVS
jgi:hypothetical protein